MARQTSIQLGEATERQIAELSRLGFGNTTAIIRTAIDRMHQQERGAYRAMNTHPVFDTRTVNRDEIAAEIVERVIVHASSTEVLDSYNNDVEAAADGIVSAWTELYPNELPVYQDGDPLDIRRYAVGYFERLAEQQADAEYTPEERQVMADAIPEDVLDETRSFTLRIRLTESERMDLQRLSDETGQTMSEYTRRRIFERPQEDDQP